MFLAHAGQIEMAWLAGQLGFVVWRRVQPTGFLWLAFGLILTYGGGGGSSRWFLI